jgi:perosamine synthetase
MIRLTIPSIDETDLNAVQQVLSSGFLVQGAHVAAFEQAVADYVGRRHAVAVSSCTAALHLALLALGVGPGDLVVVTAYSFPASANAIELCGAQPVFVDIQPDTFNMDPACLQDALDGLISGNMRGAKAKAIMPVHTFGQMADMPAILQVAGRYGLPVIEDAACALGATLHDRQAGTWGLIGCFSFHPRKAVTTGEGGAIVTDDLDLACRLRALRNHGQDPTASTPDFVLPGFNYRMTDFQAALGTTQMAKLDRIITSRRRIADHYDNLLVNSPLRPPTVMPGSQPTYQSYVTLLPDSVSERRAEIIQYMKEQGIETTIGTWHIPLTTFYRTCYGYKTADFPVTDSVYSRAMTLPLHEQLFEEEQNTVVEQLTAALGRGHWGL